MSSKRAIRRKACTGKVRHADAQAAKAHRSAVSRAHYTGPMNVYRCPFCKGFHIGHAPRRP